MSSLDTVLKPKKDLFLKTSSHVTPRALSLSFLLHPEPFDLRFYKWKRNLSLRTILWLPCNWPTGKFGSLSYRSCKCLHISLSDIKAVTIIYVTTRLIRKHFQVLGIWAQRDGHSSLNTWTLLQTLSWLWCWGQNPTLGVQGHHHHELHCWVEISKFLTGNKYKTKNNAFFK